MASQALPRSSTPVFAAGVIGFALAGFIDGILLHQVLQWHHLLSLVEGEGLRDLRNQILADGLFHVLMYAIALIGLWLLWRGRGGIDGSAADRRLLVGALLGFGLWQFVDVVGFHWLAGIHRVRVDVDNPLAWDIGWLVVFGLPPLLAAWFLRGSPPPANTGRRGPFAAALSLAVLVAGPIAALPATGQADGTVVVFRPGTGPAGALAAAAAVDARIVWADASGEVLVLQLPAESGVLDLYRHGALLVGSAPLSGCAGWSRV